MDIIKFRKYIKNVDNPPLLKNKKNVTCIAILSMITIVFISFLTYIVIRNNAQCKSVLILISCWILDSAGAVFIVSCIIDVINNSSEFIRFKVKLQFLFLGITLMISSFLIHIVNSISYSVQYWFVPLIAIIPAIFYAIAGSNKRRNVVLTKFHEQRNRK
jgi:hypothetical protein